MLRSIVLSFSVLLLAGPAAAMSFGLSCLSGGGKKCALGESQLSLEVVESGGGIAVILRNVGDGKLTASNLYLDDDAGVLGDITATFGGSTQSWGANSNPKNLPKGKAIGFIADLEAGAAKPASKNGVTPGQQVVIDIGFLGDATYQDVLDALASGELRIGVKASKSFVNVPSGIVVPEPSALALLGLAAGGALALRRRAS